MKKASSNIELWNDFIEQHFQIWMNTENYANSTVRNYSSAINRTIQNFKPLMNIAVNESLTTLEVVRKFIVLLHQDRRFIDSNSVAHNQLSAAVSALERFIDHSTSTCIVPTIIQAETENTTAAISGIIKVLSKHFKNGFKLNSPIELMRFRNFSTEEFTGEIPMTDEELKNSIVSCGTLFDGKLYVIDTETVKRIQNEVDLAISDDTEIIFYSSFYAKHENWLFVGSIISEEMLKSILVKLYPQCKYKANYLSLKTGNSTELVEIRNEIIRIWGNNTILNYEHLSERLPYILPSKIKYALTQHGDFIWNSTEVYTHFDKVDMTNEECVAIFNYVAAVCKTDGYASLSNVPIGEIKERNYELSLAAIHNAIFRIILADKYDKRGKIVTRKGDTLNALTIMKEHCRTLDKCSLKDLLDFERELTGESHRWVPMEAGYSVMVRTGAESYVAEEHLHFDVAEIDRALGFFVTGEYLPLKSVTTLAVFPHCGQAWNLFLLENYCRRFSNRFRFEVLAVNSKNAGAIIRKSCTLSYIQIMTDAVVNSNVSLDKTAIEEFLYTNGYIGRRSYARVIELIEQAKAIHEKRD